MTDPTKMIATLTLRGYPEHGGGVAGVCARIRECVETHPVLSMRLDDAAVHVVPPSGNELSDEDVRAWATYVLMLNPEKRTQDQRAVGDQLQDLKTLARLLGMQDAYRLL